MEFLVKIKIRYKKELKPNPTLNPTIILSKTKGEEKLDILPLMSVLLQIRCLLLSYITEILGSLFTNMASVPRDEMFEP